MFTKKNVVSARFINDEHTTIEVLHTIDNDDNLRPYILEYDKDCLNIQALAKAGWDLENITEETIAYKKEASRLYNEEINAAATEMNKTNKHILIANDEVMNKVLELNNNSIKEFYFTMYIILPMRLTLLEKDLPLLQSPNHRHL